MGVSVPAVYPEIQVMRQECFAPADYSSYLRRYAPMH